jgi:peroxiredoxin
MKIKTFLALFIVIAFISSCAKHPKIEIDGKLLNAHEDLVVLSFLVNNQLMAMDSAKTDEQGRFFLAARIEKPEFIFLSVPRIKQTIQLIAKPHEWIKFSADINNFAKSYQTIGSPESEAARKLIVQFLDDRHKLDSLSKLLSPLPKDSLRNKPITAEKELILQNFSQLRVDFIKDNYHSLASLMALEGLHPVEFFPYFEMVDTALMRTYPQVDNVKKLHVYVEQIREQKKNKEAANKTTLPGVKAPEIKLPDPEGKEILLSAMRGKYVLVDFWASWCKPCRTENGNLAQNYKNYHLKGLEIYQVSLDKNKQEWIAAINRDKIWWKHGCDFQYWQSSAAKAYNIQAIPSNFLIDKEGKIIARNLHGAELTKKLGELLDSVKVFVRTPVKINIPSDIKFQVGE